MSSFSILKLTNVEYVVRKVDSGEGKIQHFIRIKYTHIYGSRYFFKKVNCEFPIRTVAALQNQVFE
jgi:hypothetical protein